MIGKLHLLASARDPGAAHAMVPVLKAANCRASMRVTVVSQSPATEIFMAADIPSITVTSLPVSSALDPARVSLLHEVDGLLRKLAPDAILTGLSGPGLGVDEALIHLADGPRVYSLQDLEGLVTLGFGRPASTYFVSDTLAESLTLRHAGIRTHVVGSVKYHAYSSVDPLEIRELERGKFPVASGATRVTLYGQPSWHLDGYGESLRAFASALRNQTAPIELTYRAHPKETLEERSRTIDLFAANFLDVNVDQSQSTLTSLCATDICATCYSTCGIDLVYLQKRAVTPIGVSLFLCFPSDVQDAIERDCGVRVPTSITAGHALGTPALDDVPELLRLAMEPEVRARIWRRIRAELAAPADAPEAVLRILESDFRGVDQGGRV